MPCTGEPRILGEVVARPHGLAYTDELLADRGSHGELLLRGLGPAPQGDRGKPLFAGINIRRQRRAMRYLLCQVCGQTADRTEAGMLWVIDTLSYNVVCARGLAAGFKEPPICLPCARIAVKVCPELSKGYVALRVPQVRLVGVTGVLCAADPRPHHPGEIRVLDRSATMSYTDPRLPWMLVGEIRAELVCAAPVDLEAELGSAA
ncbi:hypothetical protein ACFXB3_02210 [Streptomyces sp. NPDC059447]|uniref:hypothetical protein n=1 Tax=Streptomyces sp. NPDC059447 TaxID=3346834 RepID=UPI00368C943E